MLWVLVSVQQWKTYLMLNIIFFLGIIYKWRHANFWLLFVKRQSNCSTKKLLFPLFAWRHLWMFPWGTIHKRCHASRVEGVFNCVILSKTVISMWQRRGVNFGPYLHDVIYECPLSNAFQKNHFWNNYCSSNWDLQSNPATFFLLISNKIFFSKNFIGGKICVHDIEIVVTHKIF